MPEPIEAEQRMMVEEARWRVYNEKMAKLFVERDKHPLDSQEREVVAQAILAVWIAEG